MAYEDLTSARSISRSAREWLLRSRKSHPPVRVLGVFEHACDLVTHGGDVIALVVPQIGDGPLNIVIDGSVGIFAGIAPRAPVTLNWDWLQIGSLRVDLDGATVWEPRPDWDALRARRSALVSSLPFLRTTCLRHAPTGGLMAFLDPLPNEDAANCAVLSSAREAIYALQRGWAGDADELNEGASVLAGLGSGLTPAGDDFLVGTMLSAWLAHPAPRTLCQAIAQAAIARTTTISAAFLRAAARGECSAAWHALLAALSTPTCEVAESKIAAAAGDILRHGATSGADSLAGFLYFLQYL